MGLKTDHAEAHELAPQAAADELEALIAERGSLPSVLSRYAFAIAASIAAWTFAIVRRDVRLAIIGGGLLISPVASWLILRSDHFKRVMLVQRLARALRVAFVAFCLYVAFQAVQGR